MSSAKEEQSIRALIDRWVETSCNQDIDGIMACYAPDVVAFDAIAALRFQGVDAYRKHWQYCLDFVPGDMTFKIPEMNISIGGDVAFCYFLATCGGTDADGNEQVGWLRGTVCLRRTNGRWLIAHEHYSVPFDPESMKALTELQP